MEKKLRKLWGIILVICVAISSIPPVNVMATSMLTGTIQVDKTLVYAGEEVEVKMIFQSTPFTKQPQPTDIVLVIDQSGSMSNDFVMLQNSIRDFVNKIDFNVHRVGVVAYSSSFTSFPLTTNSKDIINFVNNLSAGGGTLMAAPINKAYEMLLAKRPNAAAAIVLMTDGDATDKEVARQNADKAKGAGQVFYTVAFSKSADMTVINNLKKMATSEADHYSVFEQDKLSRAYTQIAGKIGAVNPTDVVVTQTIPTQFEIIPDSMANNIPQPKIYGNKITWSANQFGQGISIISYKLKVKEDTLEGTYKHATGDLTYRDYSGNSMYQILQPCDITVQRHAPNITSITPVECKNGQSTAVTMQVEYLDPKAKVYVNGSEISNIVVTGNEIKFNMPDQSVGKAVIEVVNPDKKSDSTSITIKPNAEITSITPDNSIEKQRSIIKIVGNDMLCLGDNKSTVTVMIGNKAASVISVDPKTQTIECKTPSQPKGVYDVTVTNCIKASVTKTSGFEYKEKIVPPDTIRIDSVLPNTGTTNTRIITTIKGTGFSGNKSTLSVTAGGKIASIISVTENEIVCKLPTLKPAGSYDIVVTNDKGNSVTKASAVTVTDVVPPVPSITSITPNAVPANQRSIVDINGSNFMGNKVQVTVMVGTKSASVISIEEGRINCKLPSLPIGKYPVKIKCVNGEVTLSDAIEYR